MTDKDNEIKNESSEDVNVDEDVRDENVSSIESDNDEKEKSYDDVQVLGGILLGLIVLMGGVVLLGGAGGSVGDFTYPEWADENGIVVNDETGEPDFQAAIQSHTSVLSESSYTLNIDGESSMAESGSQVSSLEYKYSSSTQTAHGIQNMEGETVETYDEFEEQRQLIAQGSENVTYDRQALLQPTPFTGANEFVELMSVLTVEASSTTQGGDVVIYEVTGVDEEMGAELDVDAEGEIHLHTEGYFTFMDVNIEDNEQGMSTSQEISVSEVGSTEVVEPDWYADALEQTDELEEEDFEPPEQEQPPQEIPEEELEDEDEPIVIE